jgi:hypothetical protein
MPVETLVRPENLAATKEEEEAFGKLPKAEQERLKRIGKPAPWADKKKACEYCSRIFDLGNYSKSHGDKCKLKSK